MVKLQEETKILNIYAPIIGTLNYIKQILINMKNQISNSTIVMGTLTPDCHKETDELAEKSAKK